MPQCSRLYAFWILDGAHNREIARVFNKPFQRTPFGAGLYYRRRIPLGCGYEEGLWNVVHHFHKSQMKCKLQQPLAPMTLAASASQSCKNKFSSAEPAEVLLTDLLWVLGAAQALVIVSVDWVCAGERKE